jgi:iron(III) transport system ATP-binding protein
VIRIDRLTKTYRNAARPAVEALSLHVEEGALVTLLGASGCGKTTTLRCLAGLEHPDSGEIAINGETVFSSARGINLPPHRRKLGMVFQSYAIWPHMTVFENVAYPLRSAGVRGEAVEKAVRWALSLVNLEDFALRPAPLLSGGQQQRVALARAIADRPRVLLLDEPLSNLDAKLRDQMRFELRELLKSLQITAVYVTHDQDEAFSLSDVTALMHGGKIVELGPPADIYQRPSTEFGAEFLGFCTKVAGEVAHSESNGGVRVSTTIGEIECQAAMRLDIGARVWVYLRPEEIRVLPPGAAIPSGALAVATERVVALGGTTEWWGNVAGVRLRGRVPTGGLEHAALSAAGAPVHVEITRARCLPVESGK